MIHTDQRVGIFVDTQNMYYSARNVHNKRVNFKNIITDAVAERKLIRSIAYVVKTKEQEEAPFFEALKKLGLELREKELMEYDSGHKKADWDVGLAVDVIRMLDMLDVVVLLSGDGDFIPLVRYAQSRGRIVQVMAFRETTNSRLIEAADAYTNLSGNKRRYMMASGRLPSNKSPSGSSSKPSKPSTEESKGFFMDEAGGDEDSRSRRLTF